MARYNSVNSTGSVAGGTAISTPASGLLTTLTGSGTVTLPNPVLYTGSTQTFYNSTGAAITLSTPSGVFTGPATGGATTISLPAGSVLTVISDGTNYLAQDWLGGALAINGTATFNGSIAANPTGLNVSIQPSGAGILTMSSGTTGSLDNVNVGATTTGTGRFSTLTATGTLSTTATTAATLGTGSTGALQSSGGASIAGILNVGGKTYFGDSVGIGTNNPGANLEVSGATGRNIYVTYVGGSQLRLKSDSGDSGIGTTNSNPLLFLINNAEKARIDTSGKLGINVTPSSATSALLQVTGGTTNVTTLLTAYSTATVVVVPKSSSGYSLAIASGTGDLPLLQVSANGTASGNLLIQPYGSFVGIGMTTAPGVTLDIGTATDAIALPKGTSAQRPTGVNGYMRFNTTINSVEFYKASDSVWVGVGIADGSSSANAAPSGQYIATNFPSFTSGYYWIKSSSMPNALRMYVDMTEESGGYDFYAFQGTGTSVSYITDTHSGKALGLELVMPRSKYHWRAMRNYVTNVLGSSDYTYFANVAGIYRTTTTTGGTYVSYAMRNPSSYGSGAPDWRVLDGGRWWLRDSTYSEPNGDYTVNGFLGDMARGSFPSGTYALADLVFNDGGTYATGTSYLVSTNAKA